jgi:ATP-binding cassette subfamily C protein
MILKKYFTKHKGLFFLVILFSILQALFGAGLAIIFKEIVNYADKIKEGSLGISTLIISIVLLFVYLLLFVLFNFLRRHFRAILIIKIDENVKVDYLKILFDTGIKEFQKNDTGHYISRFTNDIPIIVNDYIFEFLNLLLYIFEVVFILAATFYLNWILALIFLGLSIIILLYTVLFEKRFNSLKKEISESNSKYLTNIKSLLFGYQLIKQTNSESTFENKYKDYLKEPLKLKKRWWDVESVYSPGNAFLTLLLTFSSIVFSTILYADGFLSIGLLIAVIYISSSVFNPISNTFEQIVFIKSNNKLIKEVYEEFSSINKSKVKFNESLKTLSISNLSFKYDSNYIIENLSFTLEKNRKYLLIGSSGIGKSTLLKILSGQLYFQGDILFNNTSLIDIEEKSLHSLLYYGDQNSYIFNDTLRNNIDINSSYSDSEVLSAISKASLLDFMQNKTLDYLIDEELNKVSEGEKQRICLARAFLRNPQLLLLDEITASLDQINSVEIESNILSSSNSTIVYICHKLNKELLSKFDFVINFIDKQNIQVIDIDSFAKNNE